MVEVLKKAQQGRWCPYSRVDGDRCDYRGEPNRCSLDRSLPCIHGLTNENDRELCRELDEVVASGSVYADDPDHWTDEAGATWESLKLSGADHYKTGSVEPVDLYRAAGAFRPFALCSIIKYAFRNINRDELSMADMDKIIDYARKLKAA